MLTLDRASVGRPFKPSQFTPPQRSDVVSSRPAWTKSVRHKTRGLLYFGLTLVLCCAACALCVSYFAQDSNPHDAEPITPAEWVKSAETPTLDPRARWEHIWHKSEAPSPVSLLKGGSVTQNLWRSKWAQLGYTDLSRGVVLNAGPHTKIQRLLNKIRQAGCSWPVEVWHLDHVSLGDLKHHGALTRHPDGLIKKPCVTAKLQALSMFLSIFDHILFVDADHWDPKVLNWCNITIENTLVSKAVPNSVTIFHPNSSHMWVDRQRHLHELWCVYRILHCQDSAADNLYKLTWEARQQPFTWARDIPTIDANSSRPRGETVELNTVQLADPNMRTLNQKGKYLFSSSTF